MMLAAALLLLAPPFFVRVVDEATGRGVPLVELRSRNEVVWVTDSAGVAVIDEPSLQGQELYLMLRSHGYEFPLDFWKEPGTVVKVERGRPATLRMKRRNIAERLYRLTGEGIYRDSVLAGLPVPVAQPLLNGKVYGQDTVCATVYNGRLFWIWGDTAGPNAINFAVSAAVSDLPGQGGLDPSAGVNYRYFTGADGFARKMLPLPGEGLVWIEGLFTARDPQGRERLLATYTRQKGLTPPEERGVAIFDDGRELFRPLVSLPWLTEHRSSHPFLYGGYWYLYPWLRVRNDWAAITDPARWERLPETPLPQRARFSSMAWNEYRKAFLVFAEDNGKVYLTEGPTPQGPWGKLTLIADHTDYNFYNVAHHPFFNQQGGRIVYFEGTYTAAFSNAKTKTPRYDYNQVMYRLDLADPRLR